MKVSCTAKVDKPIEIELPDNATDKQINQAIFNEMLDQISNGFKVLEYNDLIIEGEPIHDGIITDEGERITNPW